jgi:GNAT superfamily N-acetyltransferase
VTPRVEPPRRRNPARSARDPVRIRKGRLSDCAAIARVMREAIRRLARGSCSPRHLAAWSSLPPLYHAWAMTAGGESYVVAESWGRIVGYAARRNREVTAVFVSPSRARSGVGAALVDRLERDARRVGARSLLARAALGAVPFYRARGFGGARRVRVPLPGGLALPALLLRKRLAAASATRA